MSGSDPSRTRAYNIQQEQTNAIKNNKNNAFFEQLFPVIYNNFVYKKSNMGTMGIHSVNNRTFSNNLAVLLD